MEDDAEFLRAQARKCRWLADRVNAPDVVETLLQMARDYEERADRLPPGEPPNIATYSGLRHLAPARAAGSCCFSQLRIVSP